MKNLLFLIMVLITFSCQENSLREVHINLIGNWVSEQKDTLSFIDSSLLVYKNFDPYYTSIYDYYIKEDSISLFPAQSSNLTDRECYYFRVC
jgi:hypothetical protein